VFTIHFVRHGEVANPEQILYGRLPRFRLSETGEFQAAAAAKSLRDDPIAAVFSSPLLRARQTAKPIAAAHDLNVRISSPLNEVLSPYEGWPVARFLEIRDIYRDIPDEYEQPQDLVRRVRRFVRRISKEFSNQQVVAVTHGDIIFSIRMWAGNVTNISEKRTDSALYPSLGSITSIHFDADEKVVRMKYREPGQNTP
jgi:broad specificity phosphatase PhoE